MKTIILAGVSVTGLSEERPVRQKLKLEMGGANILMRSL